MSMSMGMSIMSIIVAIFVLFVKMIPFFLVVYFVYNKLNQKLDRIEKKLDDRKEK